ncbi:hypothetical protein C0J52_25798 [Blattella germanica]|nr:hypothetical protein C0J52_25798 [Blattella germanica]
MRVGTIRSYKEELTPKTDRVGIYKDDPICRMCKQEEETASHILFDVHSWKGIDSPCLQPGNNCKGLMTLEPRYCNFSKEHILEDDDSTPSDGVVSYNKPFRLTYKRSTISFKPPVI